MLDNRGGNGNRKLREISTAGDTWWHGVQSGCQAHSQSLAARHDAACSWRSRYLHLQASSRSASVVRGSTGLRWYRNIGIANGHAVNKADAAFLDR
jgi:hypothetical protein